jgi:membrane protease YdiL (CAAX protease family)
MYVTVLVVLCLPAAWLTVEVLHLSPPLVSLSNILLFIIIGPLIEEAVFRGLLLTELRLFFQSPLVANFVTSMLFALLHIPNAGWMFVWWILPSYALGLVRLRGLNLMGCFFLHAWMNTCMLLV